MVKVVGFYADGFRNMTWGRKLWVLVILKVIILFAVLRVVFFRPVMAGMTDAQKSEKVAEQLLPSQGQPQGVHGSLASPGPPARALAGNPIRNEHRM